MWHTFSGGVCPAPHKDLTRLKPIAQLEQAPALVCIPLLTSSDGPAEPIVKPGDPVAVGQPVASVQRLGVPVHASVSGRVAAIEDRPHIWGGTAPAIVIENDGLNTPWEGRPRPLEPDEVTPELLLERVQEAGIVGMGGGAFPTARKLSKAIGHVDDLIVNAAECEPYITADYRLLMERSDQILRGVQVLSRCLGARRTTVVTQGDKLKAAELVERRLRRKEGLGRLFTVRTRYPLGAEPQIIQTVTGREMPHGSTPLDMRCIVLNLSTIFAIQEALFKGFALTHRAVTVSGGAVERPRNYWVPIGTPLRHLLQEAGGLKEGCAKLLTGGVMMGLPVEDLDVSVIKDTNSLLCLADWEQRQEGPETVCIRCGKCVAACPMHLSPIFVAQALRQDNERRLARLHAEDCISCGCCSYSCPANIPLVELTAQAKERLKKGGIR